MLKVILKNISTDSIEKIFLIGLERRIQQHIQRVSQNIRSFSKDVRHLKPDLASNVIVSTDIDSIDLFQWSIKFAILSKTSNRQSMYRKKPLD